MILRIKMSSPGQIIRRLGIDRDGAVQRYYTQCVSNRMTRYMPAGTQAVLSTKLKFLKSSTEILVLGPYAIYQYFGKVMVNAETGKGPRMIPGIGPRHIKGAILKKTSRNLNYSKLLHKDAGPFWDRRMLQKEQPALEREVCAYSARRNQ